MFYVIPWLSCCCLSPTWAGWGQGSRLPFFGRSLLIGRSVASSLSAGRCGAGTPFSTAGVWQQQVWFGIGKSWDRAPQIFSRSLAESSLRLGRCGAGQGHPTTTRTDDIFKFQIQAVSRCVCMCACVHTLECPSWYSTEIFVLDAYRRLMECWCWNYWWCIYRGQHRIKFYLDVPSWVPQALCKSSSEAQCQIVNSKSFQHSRSIFKKKIRRISWAIPHKNNEEERRTGVMYKRAICFNYSFPFGKS